VSRARIVVEKQSDQNDRRPSAREPLLMDVKQLAAEWGVRETQVRKWVERHHIPYRKIGGRVLFVRAVMERFLEERA
jgi:excisionase family DNA binding protein